MRATSCDALSVLYSKWPRNGNTLWSLARLQLVGQEKPRPRGSINRFFSGHLRSTPDSVSLWLSNLLRTGIIDEVFL